MFPGLIPRELPPRLETSTVGVAEQGVARVQTRTAEAQETRMGTAAVEGLESVETAVEVVDMVATEEGAI